MSGVSFAEVLELTVPERARLAQAIWDSIAEVPESVPLTDRDREEIDRRLAAYLNDPNEGAPWSEVKARILGRG
jgi:putative addiction module component (TIGR02574 family)